MPSTPADYMEKDQKYKITKAEPKDKDSQDEKMEMPAYFEPIDLSEDQKLRLSDEVFEEFDAIKKERETEGYDKDWRMLDNQYKGNLDENEDQQFNLHRHTTKVKVDTVVRYAKKAFMKSDPIYSVSPRPEFAHEAGTEVCEKQQDYLDFKLDHGGMPFRVPMGRVFHQAVLKDGGILKIVHEIRVEQRKREETYKGDPKFAMVVNPETGLEEEVMVENKGLEDFMQAYPSAMTDYPSYVKQLTEGKEINIVVEYDEIVYNDPMLKPVDPENFYIRLGVECYEDMGTTKLTVERESFLWWNLKKEEEKGRFEDVDELKYQYEDGKRLEKEKDNYATDTYNILECVYYFKLDEEDEDGEEKKIVCWIEEESKKVLGAIYYPYYAVDCYYVPFFTSDKDAGFYKSGLGRFLTDNNIAENALMNFVLEGVWARNMITPITKEGSTVDEQFYDKTWMHGLPINAEPGDVDFLQKYMQQIDVPGVVTLLNTLVRNDDDVSGVSSYITGRESPLDPEAPAKKTLALLQQSGINIEEYIENLLPSFNKVAEIILAITHQMSKEGRKYHPRAADVVGQDPFVLTRSEMVARTNIQSQAMAFNLDEANAKTENLALYQVIRQEPYVKRDPYAVYELLKAIIKKWSPAWRNDVDKVLPSPDEIRKAEMQVAMQALVGYLQGEMMRAQESGQQPVFDLNQIVELIAQARSELATPPPKEVQKERERQAKEVRKEAEKRGA